MIEVFIRRYEDTHSEEERGGGREGESEISHIHTPRGHAKKVAICKPRKKTSVGKKTTTTTKTLICDSRSPGLRENKFLLLMLPKLWYLLWWP